MATPLVFPNGVRPVLHGGPDVGAAIPTAPFQVPSVTSVAPRKPGLLRGRHASHAETATPGVDTSGLAAAAPAEVAETAATPARPAIEATIETAAKAAETAETGSPFGVAGGVPSPIGTRLVGLETTPARTDVLLVVVVGGRPHVPHGTVADAAAVVGALDGPDAAGADTVGRRRVRETALRLGRRDEGDAAVPVRPVLGDVPDGAVAFLTAVLLRPPQVGVPVATASLET